MKLSLGIDTSNYRTSVAVVDEKKNILYFENKLLTVKLGERGLRQQEALFQHINNLPELLEPALKEFREDIGCISVSVSPRPVEGSYMPCFLAGYSVANSLADALNVPLFETSHQEGHLEAIKYGSEFETCEDLIFFHFSGGTTEAIRTNSFEIVGGTKDISFGQLIDRMGIKLGFEFPSGQFLDEIAFEKEKTTSILTPIKVNDGFFNLSGIETQALNNASKKLIPEVFFEIGKAIIKATVQISEKTGLKSVIFAGGVSSSKYIRKYIKKNMPKDISYIFGEERLSTDNAVGVALLGGKSIWL